jgi:hypothetical protein
LTMATAGRNLGLSLEFRVAWLMSSRHGHVGERGSMSESESTSIIDHEKQVVWCIVTD